MSTLGATFFGGGLELFRFPIARARRRDALARRRPPDDVSRAHSFIHSFTHARASLASLSSVAARVSARGTEGSASLLLEEVSARDPENVRLVASEEVPLVESGDRSDWIRGAISGAHP